jgi:hypothetical protein
MKYIPNAVTRVVARQMLIASKHSPQILFGAGIAGVVTSTVMACRATLNLHDTLDGLEEEIAGVKEHLSGTEGYHKDLAYIYAKGAYKIARLYGPSVVVGTTSVAFLTGSHVTLTRRNASVTAAYAAVSKAFDEYRERVRDQIGPEKELDLYRGITMEEVIGENGKKVKVPVVDPNKMSAYSKCFDEYNRNWQKNAEYNRLFIQCQQTYANEMLQARGHVFLNEVYDMLGLPHTRAGCTVGWTIGNGGDNYVDFGLFEAMNSSDFMNGLERSIWLDFNVDGVIVDLI